VLAKDQNKPVYLIVYEGRLGSSRADSIFVLKNAKFFCKLTKSILLVSRRKGHSIPTEVIEEFKIVQFGKPFDPKTLVSSIFHQIIFGIHVVFFLKKLLKAKSENFVILYHDWWPLLPMIFSRSKRVMVILEVHRHLPKILIKLGAFGRVNRFIATNSIKFFELKSHFPEKVSLEQNCVDLDAYNVDEWQKNGRNLQNRTNFMVVYTGSLGKEKNPSIMITVARDLPMVDFVIVGNPPSIWDYEMLPCNLILTGPVSNSIVPKIQASADALLVTLDGKDIQSSKYTSTMKIFEYIAAKRPILAPNLPSILDILKPEEFYGYEANNPDSLKNSILILMKEKLFRMPDSKKLLKYSWEKRNLRINSLVEEHFRNFD
jgi:glycosyltransferase involved in cell wall biosynthesis